MKKEKGITLIALIITIIILLILVGVSVNLLIKGDLFGSAEKAVKGTNAKVEEQQSRVDDLMGKLNDVENKNSGNTIQEVHNWIRTGDNLTCKHCNVTLTIGQVLNYKDNGKGTSSISAEKASGYTGEETVGILNNGIKLASLNSNTNLKIAGQGGFNGPETTQTISKESNTKWVVLGAEDSNNNGTNETLLITTKTPTIGTITLYGAAGYNNCIEEINRMCKELYGEDARGMTIEDVNNCLQYTPPAGMCVKNSDDNYTFYNVPKGTKISELGTNYGDVWTDIQNNASKDESGTKIYYTPEKINGTTNASELGNIEINGYEYGLSSDGTYLINHANQTDTSNTITTATKNVIFGTSTDYSYWLASRGVAALSSCARFGPGIVNEGGAGSCCDLFDSDGSSRSRKFSLRAVVSLRSDIPAVVE